MRQCPGILRGACEDAGSGAGGQVGPEILISNRLLDDVPYPRTTLGKQGFLPVAARYFCTSVFFAKKTK